MKPLKFRRIIDNTERSEQIKTIITRYKKKAYNMIVMQQTAWFSTQLELITMLPALIEWQWIVPQTERRFLP